MQKKTWPCEPGSFIPDFAFATKAPRHKAGFVIALTFITMQSIGGKLLVCPHFPFGSHLVHFIDATPVGLWFGCFISQGSSGAATLG